MPYSRINGTKIYYEIKGSGRPIILILGLGANISQNRTIINSLAKQFRVIVLDNRDSGKSDEVKANYSIEDMAGDVRILMNKIGVKRASVIGGSMGGRIALSLALQNPGMVDKLILVSTFSGRKTWMRIYTPLLVIKPLRMIHIRMGKNPQSRRALLRQFRATINFDAGSKLATLNASTTIMHGKSDKKVSIKNAKLMNSAIKNSHLLYFNGGHLFFKQNESQEFIEAVLRVLS